MTPAEIALAEALANWLISLFKGDTTGQQTAQQIITTGQQYLATHGGAPSHDDAA